MVQGRILFHALMSSLSQAEKIMESRPDSAMAILQHIPTPETLHGKAQADYSLLMTQAMDKNYIKKSFCFLFRLPNPSDINPNNLYSWLFSNTSFAFK